MIRNEDIDDAVSRGIISRPQAEQLVSIAATRHKTRSFAVGSEERFRLLGGFNDFFIALGVVLLGVGLSTGVMLVMPDIGGYKADQTTSLAIAVPFWPVIVWWAGCALMVWLLAEVLTKRLRLTAPSIALACLWLAFVTVATAMGPILLGNTNRVVATIPIITSVFAILLHYWRFRLPFSLLLIALAGWVLTAVTAAGIATAAFNVSRADGFRMTDWVSLVYGLATFAMAMNFDRRDPERLTRKADSGFWLHMVSAPLIVHPIASPLINHPLFSGFGTQGPQITGLTVALAFALSMFLALIAIIVDRRALLVTGLGYLGGALVFALSQLTGGGNLPGVMALLILGSAIILLGIGWRSVRRLVMSSLPDGAWKRGLPPISGGAAAGA
jgi:hypothetical protein